MARKILVVEDERQLSQTISDYLEDLGFEVASAFDGVAAMERFERFQPDLVLLDWNLPGMPGIDVCKKITEINSDVAIIMVSAKTEVDDRITGLEAGAADYLPKPFSFKELEARINVQFRLRGVSDAAELVIGPLVINVPGHEVKKNGERISLTPLEFNLLQTLAEKPKQVFSREELLEKVWDYHYRLTPVW